MLTRGVFFVDFARRADWFQDHGSLTVRGGSIFLRRWSPRENMVVLRKFKRGWLELRGLPFHLWDEDQLRYIMKNWGKVTKVARDSKACRLVEGKVVGGDASKCRATCAARGGRWGLDIHGCNFSHRRS